LINDGFDDEESISSLNEEDLVKCGISKTGHRRKMLKNLPQEKKIQGPSSEQAMQTEEKDVQSTECQTDELDTKATQTQTEEIATQEEEIQTDTPRVRHVGLQTTRAKSVQASTQTTASALFASGFLQQEEILIQLQQLVMSSIVLLECKDVQIWIETKFHPADIKALPALKTTPELLAKKFEKQEANTSLPDMVLMLTGALAQLQGMRHAKDANRYWTICKVKDDIDVEKYYQAKWKAIFIYGKELAQEEDSANVEHLDGEMLTFRYTNNKWYICNF
jgi:hypothetical protein